MWAIDNRTPYAAERTWIRDADGAEVWIVAVKATYELLPDGRTRVAERQIPVNSGLVLHEDGVSPAHETDLGPTKAATDVWLSGHAWSQSGRPVSRLRVGFEVGPVARHLDVHGERHWQRDVLGRIASQPEPFTRMPLTWARAYGGDGPEGASDNPVGRGLGEDKDRDGGRLLPNLEHPKQSVSNLLRTPVSMGVGPIPRHWPPRAQYAGTCDAQWRATRAPLQPSDLDPRHWQVCAPEQQVPGRLKGGEDVLLWGVTPPGFAPADGVYRTRVPRLSLGFKTHFYDGSGGIASRSVIHSLILLPDLPALCVVHHMALHCHAKVNLLDKTVITEKARPLDPPQQARAAAPPYQP